MSAPDQGEPPPDTGTGDGQVTEDNQGDPQITKSPSDPKKYRYIELSNGLRALLISDLSTAGRKGGSELTDEQEEGEEGDEEEEGEEGDEEEEGEEGDGEEGDEEKEGEEGEEEEEGEEGDEEEEGEEGDEEEGDEEEVSGDCLEEEPDRDFDEAENAAKKKKKSRSSEKQAAAALCVAVGSFSDPDDLPGLAHFLEHMVFMGSEKYPAENGFDAFLTKHGGGDNASTDCERTTFRFDVPRTFFREALDRWAQFFVCPLMVEDAVDRELEAVDSEYLLASPSDSYRREMLFGSLAKPGHPMTKFCWGNAQTLKHTPREKRINTYQRLRDFWTRCYSAHYMTLAVQSEETLDTLEQWVSEIFSNIPNNREPGADFSHLQQPFDTPHFNKLYRGGRFRFGGERLS